MQDFCINNLFVYSKQLELEQFVAYIATLY